MKRKHLLYIALLGIIFPVGRKNLNAQNKPESISAAVHYRSIDPTAFSKHVLRPQAYEWGLTEVNLRHALNIDGMLHFRRRHWDYGPYIQYTRASMQGAPDYLIPGDDIAYYDGSFTLNVHQMIAGAHLGIHLFELFSDEEAEVPKVDMITRLKFGVGMTFFHRHYDRYSYLRDQAEELRRTTSVSCFQAALEAELRFALSEHIVLGVEAAISGSKTAKIEVHDLTDGVTTSFRPRFDWSGIYSGLRVRYLLRAGS